MTQAAVFILACLIILGFYFFTNKGKRVSNFTSKSKRFIKWAAEICKTDDYNYEFANSEIKFYTNEYELEFDFEKNKGIIKNLKSGDTFKIVYFSDERKFYTFSNKL